MLGIQIMDVEKYHQILVHQQHKRRSICQCSGRGSVMDWPHPLREDWTKLVTPNIGFQANWIFALHTAFPYTIAHLRTTYSQLETFAQHCTCKSLKASRSFVHELFSLLAINLQLCAKYLKLIINYFSQYLQCRARQDRFSKMNYGQLNDFLSSAASTCIGRPWAERAVMFAFTDFLKKRLHESVSKDLPKSLETAHFIPSSTSSGVFVSPSLSLCSLCSLSDSGVGCCPKMLPRCQRARGSWSSTPCPGPTAPTCSSSPPTPISMTRPLSSTVRYTTLITSSAACANWILSSSSYRMLQNPNRRS